ncbi:hypothetical protein BTR23_01690 [Alkalihalophilus pseudofirmus]|nr:hypothetical protein BTR23_01690 [Alkalihalophilus pseudofirmus]
MNETLKLGIVGLGHVAEHQLKAIEYEKNIKISAICDFNERKKDNMKWLNNVRFYKEYKALFDTDIDAVLISTPNITHYEICKEALHKGIHVLLEKPATHEPHLLYELKEIATSKNLVLHIAYHAAFAKDVIWFINYYHANGEEILGPLTGFQCQFYDPYIKTGKLSDHAINLQGSWIDSGVNALSVIERFLNINSLDINSSRLGSIEGFDCNEIHGIVDFRFPINGAKRTGRGQIETNWMLNQNYKQTKLFFDDSNTTIILNHTEQKVYKLKDLEMEELKDCSEGMPRLINHYIGVMKDFSYHIKNKTDNLSKSVLLHDLLFKPYSLKEGQKNVIK